MSKRFSSKVLNKFNSAFYLVMGKANSSNLWCYNKALRTYSNMNRNAMTKAEACLWKYSLSKRQMEGYQFLRQRPVLSYIADFMCKELMLIIEVDGITHQWEEVAMNDFKREQDLKVIGFTVLRFDDNDVLNHIDDVSYRIRDYIIDFKKRNSTILPFNSPSSGGYWAPRNSAKDDIFHFNQIPYASYCPSLEEDI